MTKGDIIHGEYLIECKATDAERFSVTLDTVRKIEHEAMGQGRTGIMAVRLGDDTVYWVLPDHVFLALLGED